MPSKLDELKRKAQQTARDLDEKYKITSKLDEGARKTTDALRKGKEVATATLDDARQEAERFNREHRLSERVSETTRRAVDAADEALNNAGVKKKAGEVIDGAGAAAKEAGSRAAEAASDAKEKAADFFGEARRYYEQASDAARTTASCRVSPWPLSIPNTVSPSTTSVGRMRRSIRAFATARSSNPSRCPTRSGHRSWSSSRRPIRCGPSRGGARTSSCMKAQTSSRAARWSPRPPATGARRWRGSVGRAAVRLAVPRAAESVLGE